MEKLVALQLVSKHGKGYVDISVHRLHGDGEVPRRKGSGENVFF